MKIRKCLWRNLESIAHYFTATISAGLVSLGTVKLGKHFMTLSIPVDMVKLTERVRGHFMTLTKCNIHQIDMSDLHWNSVSQSGWLWYSTAKTMVLRKTHVKTVQKKAWVFTSARTLKDVLALHCRKRWKRLSLQRKEASMSFSWSPYFSTWKMFHVVVRSCKSFSIIMCIILHLRSTLIIGALRLIGTIRAQSGQLRRNTMASWSNCLGK